MFRGLINNGNIASTRIIKLNNPLQWSCIGYSDISKATSFYIPEIDTLIDTGVLFYLENTHRFILPQNILISRNNFNHTRYINFYENYIKPNGNIFSQLCIPDRIVKSNILPQTDTIYDLSSSYSLYVKQLIYTHISYSYGIIYNNNKQVIFMGNTTIDTLYEYSYWKDYPVVFVDCHPHNSTKYDLAYIIRKNLDISYILLNVADDKIVKYNEFDNVYIWTE
jgi:hypothetical protein